MFFGGLAENKPEIKVPDVEPQAFLTLLKYVLLPKENCLFFQFISRNVSYFLILFLILKIQLNKRLMFLPFRYLYCDEIQLEADNVLATLYVAKKYIVPHLARACVNYLETSLTAKNACLLLSQSRLFEEPDLMQRCWEVIDAQVCDTVDRDSINLDYTNSAITMSTSSSSNSLSPSLMSSLSLDDNL